MLKPLADHVLIQPVAVEEKTASGLYLPDTAHKDKPQMGKVIAVGSGRILPDGNVAPMELKAGETVVFAKYVGTEVHHEGVDYLLMKEQDVLAVVTEEKKASKKK